MKIKIIDENHIMIQASSAEETTYSNHTRLLIDNIDSFVCNSEPSTSAFAIVRPLGGSLFNVSLDISNSPFTTNELLIAFLELDDLTYPFVFPVYNNEKLMETIANQSGILDEWDECGCFDDLQKVCPILLYYGFKLSLTIFDFHNAIKYWKRINKSCKTKNIKCRCNGY